ncbi:bile acid:sodium symporter family protein [Desulfitobacterium sp.]|uniref:bile acid:sodium symporter family protein n=1 Tax=Desulfitobacterium sp. TaxID=49981 RepID=UPI002B8EE7CF|nr:bile acid:sodium symporter family protein [Desulfitobacterium sp.]HVJ48722.1 bile acid:sodium symporter family protein [Desulfitobacterium sp.]
MLSYLAAWNRWLGKRMFFVTLIALIIGFNFSLPNFLLSQNVTLFCFIYLTFITSLDIHFKDLLRIIKHPVLPIGMLILIHAVMPIIAGGIGFLFYPQDFYTRLGFLISSVIPIGLTSIVWTGIAGGDVVLALVVVMLDTLLSPLILPGFFSLVLGQSLALDYSQMVLELIEMVALPSLAGMALNDITKGKVDNFSHSIGGLTAKIGVFFIILINAANIAPNIVWGISILKLLLVILLLMLCGYLVGYLASFALRNRTRATVLTMIFNVGMRNINFGFVLAITYFPIAVAIPVTLASVFNQPLASIFAWFSVRNAPEDANVRIEKVVMKDQ